MNNPLETSLFDKAVKLAVEAHSGTERRCKGYPYIIHPMEAVAIVATMTNDQEMLAAAILHDVVEDTDVTLEQIRDEFGDRVATLVQHETAPDDENLTWREKKSIQVERLAAAPIDSKIVALGDKLSNMQGIALDYRQGFGVAFMPQTESPMWSGITAHSQRLCRSCRNWLLIRAL